MQKQKNHILKMKFLLMTAAIVVVVYVGLLLAVWANQEHLLFAPQVIKPDDPTPQWILEPDVHETTLDVPGAQLSLLELRLPNPKGVVFFLHGNAGNNRTWAGDLDFYRSMNFDLAMIDYRGYGKSTGQITSQKQLRNDVKAAWKSVSARYAGKRIVFFGRSLGTGLAAGLASSLPVSAQPDITILVSPYSSMVATAAYHYPWVPSRLLHYPLQTDHLIEKIKKPILLIHGNLDDVIPLQQSEALKKIVPAARLEVIQGAGHGDLQEHKEYIDMVRAAVKGD